MKLTRKQLRLLFIVGLVIGAAGVPGAAMLADYLSNSVSVGEGVSIGASNGPQVKMGEAADVNLTHPYPDDNTVEIRSSKGNITFSSPGVTNVTVDNINGTFTELSGLNVTGANLTVSPEDKQTIAVGGETDVLEFRDVNVNPGADGQQDVFYSGTSGTTTLIIHGLPADTHVEAIDLSNGNALGYAKTDSSGVATFTGLPNSQHQVDLRTFSPQSPDIQTGTATPNGSRAVSEQPIELSVDVTDGDFPDDELTVEFYVDGSSVGTDTLTSNGTATHEVTQSLTTGAHTWSVTVEDQYGNEVSSKQFDLLLPDELSIRKETAPNEFIKDNVTVELTIYGENEQYERSTENGNISLSGLPADQQLIVVTKADGYYTRRTIIDSVVEQQSIYLLNESKDAVQNQFILNDLTGVYPTDETRLYIQRALNQSGELEFRTIAGDYFGATGEFPAYLQQDGRYRLIVENSDGDRRVLGSYQASQPGPQTIRLGRIEINALEADTYTALTTTKEAGGEDHLLVQFTDPAENTTNFDVRVYPRGNESDPIFTDSASGPLGNYSANVTLPNGTESGAYVVNWTADRGDEQISQTIPLGGANPLDIPLAGQYLGTLGMLFIVLIASLGDQRFASHIALATVAMAGILMATQIVDIFQYAWWGAALIAVGAHLKNRRV